MLAAGLRDMSKQSVLEFNTGYNVWYGGIEWQCKMRVYGNGNMVLPY
jgi:hypothetical protein